MLQAGRRGGATASPPFGASLMNKIFLAGTALAAFAAFPASAQPPAGAPEGPVTRAQMQQDVEARFKEMDANHDGTLTEAELGPNGARMMQRLDTNHDG